MLSGGYVGQFLPTRVRELSARAASGDGTCCMGRPGDKGDALVGPHQRRWLFAPRSIYLVEVAEALRCASLLRQWSKGRELSTSFSAEPRGMLVGQVVHHKNHDLALTKGKIAETGKARGITGTELGEEVADQDAADHRGSRSSPAASTRIAAHRATRLASA
ncbi:hypothetical protein SVIO_083310 [Streptomyces violaceusniger]|uniref:Uncharacterized protein n=1 Tax=Streptomyces violaceusniger TaxID=68280 RepID=A0A4D4LGT9_STRVO|nr:hypothetical protein SVIO_083310 [Streptomyces violaceusniger]